MWINGKHIHSCTGNLEGILAKRKGDPYLPDHANWLNRNYARWVGREELFERERPAIPTGICGMLVLWSRTKSLKQYSGCL